MPDTAAVPNLAEQSRTIEQAISQCRAVGVDTSALSSQLEAVKLAQHKAKPPEAQHHSALSKLERLDKQHMAKLAKHKANEEHIANIKADQAELTIEISNLAVEVAAQAKEVQVQLSRLGRYQLDGSTSFLATVFGEVPPALEADEAWKTYPPICKSWLPT